jgi:hypothetical protein
MREIQFEVLYPTQRSPCLSCRNRRGDKELCISTCPRVSAYHEGTGLLELMGEHRHELVVSASPDLDHGAILVAPHSDVLEPSRRLVMPSPRSVATKKGLKRAAAKRLKKSTVGGSERPASSKIVIPINETSAPIIKAVKRIAGQEMRSVTSQVLHMLQGYLERHHPEYLS